MKRSLTDHPVFFLSYDEPGAIETYRDLSAHAPCAITHVHGVHGPDAAIRTCAEQSESDRFVTISADNRVNPALFFQKVPVVEEHTVQVFRSTNTLNGLSYENGGVKIWPRDTVLLHPTRETATIEAAFGDVHYPKVAIDFLGSHTNPALSPMHAYRSAYREVMRLSLIGGVRLRDFSETWGRLSQAARSRILVWGSVGSDRENGWWAILGARQAMHDFFVMNFSHHQIHNFDAFGRDFPKLLQDIDPEYAAKALRRKINAKLNLDLGDLEPQESRLVRSLYVHPPFAGAIGENPAWTP